MRSNDKLNNDLKDILNNVLEGFKESPWWYGWKNTSFQNGYSRLKSLINEVEKYKEVPTRAELAQNN